MYIIKNCDSETLIKLIPNPLWEPSKREYFDFQCFTFFIFSLMTE